MKSKEKLIETLQWIVKRPTMYGIENVHHIYIFCMAFSYGSYDGEPDAVGDFLIGFGKHVNKKFKIGKSEHAWSSLIRFYSAGDKHSIEVFGSVLNEYLEKQNKLKKKK